MTTLRRISGGLAALVVAAAFALACAGAAPARAQNVLPEANFGFHPDEPVSGQIMSLRSYACDPDGRLTEQAWDLNGDGTFDALGRTVLTAFGPGRHSVSLRVTDRSGAFATRSRTIEVVSGNPDYVESRRFVAPLLSPFPIVRVAGTVTARGARVRLLTVRAPVCSRVRVRCTGESCPRRRWSRLVAREALRVRPFQRQLAAGTVVEVLISKRDRIGKYTRFRIRRGRPPARRDLCLRPGANEGTRCPSG